MVAPAPAEPSGVWRRTWAVIDERLGLSALAYPVPRHANGIAYILGGVTAVGMLVLIVTGWRSSTTRRQTTRTTAFNTSSALLH